MMYHFKIVFWLAIAMGMMACASNQAESTAYMPNAIDVGIAATPDLNFYNNQAHAVTVTFYELAKTDFFNRMLTSREGRAQLVVGTEFDKSVLSHRSIVIQPGEFRQHLLDREEGARYLAAVAGYYRDDPRRISRVYPIQFGKKSAFFWGKFGKKPKMSISMRLGKDGIVVLKATRPQQ